MMMLPWVAFWGMMLALFLPPQATEFKDPAEKQRPPVPLDQIMAELPNERRAKVTARAQELMRKLRNAA